MKKSNSKNNEFYEMSRQSMEDLFQSNLDTLKELIDIELDYANLWQEYMKAQMDRLSTAKEISDVMAIESGLTAEYTNKFSETGRRLVETVSGAMEKQMKSLNMPADFESLLPDFHEYSDMLGVTPKKSKPARKTGD